MKIGTEGVCSTPRCYSYGLLQANGKWACKRHKLTGRR